MVSRTPSAATTNIKWLEWNVRVVQHTANTPLTKRHRATAGRVLAQIMPGFLRLGAPEVGNEGRKRGPRWLLTPGRYNGRFVTVFFYYVKRPPVNINKRWFDDFLGIPGRQAYVF